MSRINARLDDNYVDKLEALKSRLNTSTTGVLKQAIDELYQQQVANDHNKINNLLNSNFIACGKAEYDLSAEHKQYLAKSLENKYDHS